MTTTYMVCHRERQHITLFTAVDLSETALCLIAQPDTEQLLVYANDGGFSRELTASECQSLGEHMRRASG